MVTPLGKVVGEDGRDGVDGVGVVSVSGASFDANGNTIVTVTLSDGTTSAFTVNKGTDAASISDIAQTVSSLESGGANVITITLSDNTTRTFSVMNGAKGDAGAPFQIAKTYASVSAMSADASVPSGAFVVIASNTEDPDNAKLYVKTDSGYSFITDLSGAQGIQGPAGTDGVSVSSVTHTPDANGNIAVTIALSNGNASTFTIPKGDKGDNGTFSPEGLQRIADLEDENALLRELIEGIDAPIYRTASGNPATFTDGCAANVRELVVTLAPTQEGEGGPSPDNIRPISGVSSVSVTRTGKNLFGPQSGIVASNATVTPTPSGFRMESENAKYAGFYLANVFLKKTAAYTVSFDAQITSGLVMCGLNRPGENAISPSTGRSTESGHKRLTFSPERDGFYNIRFLCTYNAAMAADVTLSNLMLTVGNEVPAAYEPYREGQSVTVPLVDSNSDPLTVYGGTLNVTTGELTVTWANIASYDGETLPGVWISDRDVYAEGATPTTGAQVAYELASPVTYQLAPAQLAALSGYNAVSADADALSVEYRADPAITLGG